MSYVIQERRWRIEKRDIIDGSLVSAFGTSGVLISNPSGNQDELYSLSIDANNIYATGADSTNGISNARWRIEKRDIVDGS